MPRWRKKASAVRLAGCRRVMLLLALTLLGPSTLASSAEEDLALLDSKIVSGPALGDVVRYAYRENPRLRAAREAVIAETARSRIETGLPDPSLVLNWDTKGTEDFDSRKWSLMLSQTIPAPGKLAAVGRARREVEQIARLELERSVREILLQLRESYHELRYVGEARQIARQSTELLALVRGAGQAAYARDRAALSELLRAESQEGQVRYDELLLEELERTERARLNAILNRPVGAGIGPLATGASSALAFTREEIQALAEAAREEVLIAEATLRQMKAETEVAAAETRPELMLGLGYMSEAPPIEDEPRMKSLTLQAGVSLPLWPGKNRGRRRASEADRQGAAALKVAALNEVGAAVQESFFRLANAERLVALYAGSLLPQAAKAMELADIWYRDGAGSFSGYTESVAVWYNFQLALARARADAGKYLARLEALAGRTLTERSGADAEPGSSGEPALYRSLAVAGAAPSAATGAGAPPSGWKEERGRLARMRDEAERSGAPEASAFLVPPKELGERAGDAVAVEADLARGFTLAHLEALALLRSPAIQAAAGEHRAALESYGQVANIDDVLRRYGAFTASLMTGVGAMGDQGSPAMLFPHPGLMTLKGEAVNEAVRAARETLEIARREAVTEVRRIFWNLTYVNRATEAAERTAAILVNLEETARRRYEAGQSPLQETLDARMEAEKIRTEVVTLQQERESLEARLRSLLDLAQGPPPLGPPLAVAPPPPFPPPAALVPVALEQRQELRRMRAEAARMERMIEMGEKELLPLYSQGLSLTENRAVQQAGTAAEEETFPTGVPAAAGAGQPRSAWSGGEAAYLRETRAALQALRRQIRAEEQATISGVNEGWFAFDRARREEQLYRVRLGELALLSARVADAGYRAGTASFAGALGAARNRYDLEREAARRHADLGIAAAELEARLGTTRWAERAPTGAGAPAAPADEPSVPSPIK